ncbi:MAG: GNAT family N-acetyltransferase [Nannocystaceae bacterium]
MSAHVLDRPVWTSLATEHARFALGDDRARRLAPALGPFAAARDDDPESLAALSALASVDGPLVLLQADPIALPPRLAAAMTAEGVQMIYAERVAPRAPAIDVPLERLTAADAPAMVALAAMTKPGPFALRTHELGDFWGARERGQLIAMAGERLRQDGFTEVSGVCTHPDARGRGLARLLSTRVTAQILARGDTPYLHAYAANAAAIGLYESLGYRLRAQVHVAVVRPRRTA